MRKIIRWLLKLLYGFAAYNEQALSAPGPVLLLPNHVSWWDWLLVGVCLEEDWRFVTSSTSARTSWLHQRIMVNRRTFPVDMTSPYAVKHMAEYLQKGGRLVLFPEGRISTSGALMKLFEGTGFLLAKTGAKVITCYLRGAERLPLSRNPGRKRLFPRISAHFSDPLSHPAFAHKTSSEYRAELTVWVERQMVRQQFEAEMEFGARTIPEAVRAGARIGGGKVVLEDGSLAKLSYRRLLTGANLLAREWRQRLPRDAGRIGVLLPNVNAMPVTLLSLWADDRVPAVLNFTMGPATLQACARVANLQHVITSRQFITRAKLDLRPLADSGVTLHFLEEIRAEISAGSRLFELLRQTLRPSLPLPHLDGHRSAAVLFTSGSEGEPKAVDLSHGNLLANIRQMVAVIDLMETDRFFNALPLFHSFGLTIGLLLPLVRRVYTLLYPSPLHYRIIPAAVYNLNCTVLFGTNTFLSGYARKAHPYDFHSLRYVFAGAEKLQPNVVEVWQHKFGIRVLEGYGATECSPCLSVNVPMHPCQGSAGRFLPGIDYRLEPVQGVTGKTGPAGRLFVRGPNIMRGYLNAEPNARFQQLNGWYDTGDVVEIDPHGFVFILGRLKRFAKISGEMISLTAVEEALNSGLRHYGPKLALAIIGRADTQRGERLVAVTNDPQVQLEEIREILRAQGFSNLAAPREVKVLPDLPRLGTGKINYRELEGRV